MGTRREALARGVTAILSVMLIVALLLPVSALAGSPDKKADRIHPVTAPAEPGKNADRIHPLLGKMADQDPGGVVRVIVQGRNTKGELDKALDKHGARSKKALPLVKGFAAKLPVGKARALAQDPSVNWVTVDAPMVATVGGTMVSDASLVTDFPVAVGASSLWTAKTPITGSGVTVAVIDSGVNDHLPDFSSAGGSRVLANVKFSSGSSANADTYGHGTHVAGIIAGNGKGSEGKYIGIAPDAGIVGIKVSDARGMAYLGDVIDALQWVILNRDAYNIRVVNLSLVSSVPESYKTSPLAAAVELAWLSGIVVVVSSGNQGADSILYPPANDPFVITVGAVDTAGTTGTRDDVVATWSGYGTTQDGFAKPEVVAPGRRIISYLSTPGCELAKLFTDRVVDGNYLRLSGTSMAAPVVSGVAALALQAHPEWTPDQFKSALVATARSIGSPGAGAGEVYAPAVVSTNNAGYANQDISFNAGVAGTVGGSAYNSATWDSATWDSATWDSATWDSATWDSATWDSATWDSATWDSATWDSVSFPD